LSARKRDSCCDTAAECFTRPRTHGGAAARAHPKHMRHVCVCGCCGGGGGGGGGEAHASHAWQDDAHACDSSSAHAWRGGGSTLAAGASPTSPASRSVSGMAPMARQRVRMAGWQRDRDAAARDDRNVAWYFSGPVLAAMLTRHAAGRAARIEAARGQHPSCAADTRQQR
jgi:hypothetical protein